MKPPRPERPRAKSGKIGVVIGNTPSLTSLAKTQAALARVIRSRSRRTKNSRNMATLIERPTPVVAEHHEVVTTLAEKPAGMIVGADEEVQRTIRNDDVSAEAPFVRLNLQLPDVDGEYVLAKPYRVVTTERLQFRARIRFYAAIQQRPAGTAGMRIRISLVQSY